MKPTAQAFNAAVAHLYALPDDPTIPVNIIGPEHVSGMLCQLYEQTDVWLDIAGEIEAAVASVMGAQEDASDPATAFAAWWPFVGAPFEEAP